MECLYNPTPALLFTAKTCSSWSKRSPANSNDDDDDDESAYFTVR